MIIIDELHNTRREQGLTVTSACLPPSVPRLALRHCLRWDWALPHGSRKQRTHSTQLFSITVTNSNRIKARFQAPPGAHQGSIPDTPPQRLRSRGRCLRSYPSSSSISLHPTRLPKRPSVVFQLRPPQPSNNHPCHHWYLLRDHVLAAPPLH